MENLGFKFFGTKKASYFKNDEILIFKEYHCNKKNIFKSK